MTSERKREQWRRAAKKYAKTDKGKASLARYEKSEKGKVRRRRYERTEKGVEKARRYEADPMRKIAQTLNKQKPEARITSAIYERRRRGSR